MNVMKNEKQDYQKRYVFI